MPCVTRRIAFPLLATLTAVLAGCSSPKPAYEREDFAQSDTYSRTFPAASNAACDAGRRALLSQGYNIDKFEPSRVTGHKNFEADDGQHTQISFNIECASDASSNERATVFANAVQDRYSIKRTGNSASVGVSVLGQVSMPFGGSDDSLVKTGSQTVTRAKFYDGFFQLLQRFLPDAQAAAAPREPAPARGKAATPKPAVPADPVVSPNAPADTLNPAAAGGDKAAPAATPSTSGSDDAAKPAPAAAAPETPVTTTPATAAPAAGSPAAGSPAAGSPAAGSPAAGSPAAGSTSSPSDQSAAPPAGN